MNPFRGIKWLVDRASRNTSTGQFIAEIDGLRFIAIMSVFLFHLGGYLKVKTGRNFDVDPIGSLFTHGHIGVQLFFVISGFVIALPFAKGHLLKNEIPSLKQFFIRRLTRLEPPYLIALIISFLLIKQLTFDKAIDLVPHMLASMFYLHNIIFSSMSTISGVAWTLEIELQFYILAPLLTYFFKIRDLKLRRGIFLALIMFFSIVKYLKGSETLPLYNLTLLTQAQYFFTGFLLLDVYLIDWKQTPDKIPIWDVVSALAWSCIVVVMYMGTPATAFICIPIFIAYCAAFKGPISNMLFCHPVIYTIGGMCYTIYLYHSIILSNFARLFIKIDIINQMPIWASLILISIFVGLITLFFCALLFIYIEKPCMKKGWYLNAFNWRLVWAKPVLNESE